MHSTLTMYRCILASLLIAATTCSFTIADSLDDEFNKKVEIKNGGDVSERLENVPQYAEYFKQPPDANHPRVLKAKETEWLALLAVPTYAPASENIILLESEDPPQFSNTLSLTKKSLNSLTLSVKHYLGSGYGSLKTVHDLLLTHFKDKYYKTLPVTKRENIIKICFYYAIFNATDEGKPDQADEGDYIAAFVSCTTV